MTPARTHGLIQVVAERGPDEASDLRREAVELRTKADENERIAGVIEAMYAIAMPHARKLEVLDGGAA